MSSLFPDPKARPASYDRFLQAYEGGNPPWDTKITPPELVAEVEGPQKRTPGRALDLGCGTGTNSLYLASHGWNVTGIDFIPSAIEQAREKQYGAGQLSGNIHFLVGDVTQLEALRLESGYTLLFDLGCLHSLEESARGRYARGIVRLAAPGALFLLYGFLPNHLLPNRLTRSEVQALFGPAFTLERVVESLDRPGIPAAWYWLHRAR